MTSSFPIPAPTAVLKRVVVAFWVMFFTIVTTSNIIDLLDVFGFVHWSFLDSTNFAYIRTVVAPHGVGTGAAKMLLLGATAAEATGALLCWWALLARGGGFVRRALTALTWSAGLWTAFVFMTELFTAYNSESPFRELLTLTLCSALVVALVPDDAR